MSETLGRLDLDEIVAAISDHQRELLEGMALEIGFPPSGWTAVPALTLMAHVFGTMAVARELDGKVIDENASGRRFTATSAIDTAAASFYREGREPMGPAKSVRLNLSRWFRNLR